MSDSSTPMDYAEAVWRTAEIRMMIDDEKKRLDSLPPFARHFALKNLIARVEKVIENSDTTPEFKEAVLRMYRSWERM